MPGKGGAVSLRDAGMHMHNGLVTVSSDVALKGHELDRRVVAMLLVALAVPVPQLDLPQHPDPADDDRTMRAHRFQPEGKCLSVHHPYNDVLSRSRFDHAAIVPITDVSGQLRPPAGRSMLVT